MLELKASQDLPSCFFHKNLCFIFHLLFFHFQLFFLEFYWSVPWCLAFLTSETLTEDVKMETK